METRKNSLTKSGEQGGRKTRALCKTLDRLSHRSSPAGIQYALVLFVERLVQRGWGWLGVGRAGMRSGTRAGSWARKVSCRGADWGSLQPFTSTLQPFQPFNLSTLQPWPSWLFLGALRLLRPFEGPLKGPFPPKFPQTVSRNCPKSCLYKVS